MLTNKEKQYLIEGVLENLEENRFLDALEKNSIRRKNGRNVKNT